MISLLLNFAVVFINFLAHCSDSGTAGICLRLTEAVFTVKSNVFKRLYFFTVGNKHLFFYHIFLGLFYGCFEKSINSYSDVRLKEI